MKTKIRGLLAVCAALLCLGAVNALAADETYTGTVERRDGYELASVRYALPGEDTYAFAEVTTAEDGSYTYSFTAPAGEYEVTPEYFSTTVWDGAVDISWYDPAASEYYISNGAQLAGVAAICSGSVDANTPDYRIRGDLSLLESEIVENFELVGAGGGNVTQTVHRGLAKNSFAGKTIYLTADINMGGQTDATNWTPIGGIYPMKVDDETVTSEADPYLTVSYFAGVLDGNGHRIINIYCDRHNAAHFSYSQGIGLVGYLGGLYDGQSAPALNPAVRNLSVSGLIHGRRMVGGIVGRVGDRANFVSVENCANYAEVISHDAKGVGGIVGAGWAKDGAIINCYNTGYVHNSDYQCPAGGICGNNQNMDIYNCYNVGTIYAAGARGRAIGGHDGGVYSVRRCYYLEGCDNNPESNGWYRGTGTDCVIECTAFSQTFMQSLDFLNYLNGSGDAFVYNPGGYPLLFWEAGRGGTVEVSVEQPTGGMITPSAAGTVRYGQIVYLTNTPDTAWAFRSYTFNGTETLGDYFTATADTVVSGTFESMKAGVLNIEYNDACEITVTKNGTVIENGESRTVTDYPVRSGDEIYENDVLTAKITWREGAYPENPDLVYLGMTDPASSSAYYCTYSYTGKTGTSSMTKSHTVTSDITKEGTSLTLSVQPKTTHKRWSDPNVRDISWYNETDTTFTLTTARQLGGLAYLCKNGESFAGKTILLGNDISLKNDDGTIGDRWWGGIGIIASQAFSGMFDGQGHMVYDMISKTDYSGTGFFIRCSGATVRNLTVSGVSRARSVSGGIAATADGSTFENCVSYAEVTASDSSVGKAAGIAAQAESTVFRGCFNYGDITGSTATGGIAGTLTENTSRLEDCANYGSVYSVTAGSNGIGGLAGSIEDAGTVVRCANYGTVSGMNTYIGGLVGYANGGSGGAMTILDSYNAGDVTSTSTRSYSGVGGITGRLRYCAVQNSFNYGAVSGNYNAGAVAGIDDCVSSSRAGNVYYLETSCAAAFGSVKAGTGKTVTALTADEMAGETFLGQINTDECFVLLENAVHPELSFTAGKAHTHSGGTANCHAQAVCESCHMPYGALDPNNHDGERELRNARNAVWTTDGYTGDICCAGCDAVLEAGEVIPASTDPVLTLYEQTGDGEAKLVKTYTAAELSALFEANNEGTLAYQYWKDGTENFMVATQYATLPALFKDAGLTFAAGDTLVPDSKDDAVTWERFEEKQWYFTSETEKQSVTPCLAFAFEIGRVPQTVEETAAAAKITGSLRLGIGASDYGNEAGARLVQNITKLTLVHSTPAYILGDVNGNGVVNNVDAALVYMYYNNRITLTETQLLAADVNGNGTVNNVDAALIYMYYNNRISAFPAEK